RAWANERVTTWRPLAGLGLGVLAVVGWIALCLGYRVAQVPEVGEPFDVAAFVASIPPPEKNQAGELIRQGLRRMSEHEQGLTAPHSAMELGGGEAAVAPGAPLPP